MMVMTSRVLIAVEELDKFDIYSLSVDAPYY